MSLSVCRRCRSQGPRGRATCCLKYVVVLPTHASARTHLSPSPSPFHSSCPSTTVSSPSTTTPPPNPSPSLPSVSHFHNLIPVRPPFLTPDPLVPVLLFSVFFSSPESRGHPLSPSAAPSSSLSSLLFPPPLHRRSYTSPRVRSGPVAWRASDAYHHYPADRTLLRLFSVGHMIQFVSNPMYWSGPAAQTPSYVVTPPPRRKHRRTRCGRSGCWMAIPGRYGQSYEPVLPSLTT